MKEKLQNGIEKTFLVLKFLALYYVSGTLVLFAVSKFFGAQFQEMNFMKYIPLGELSDRQLAWAFFGRSYNYNLFLGIIEFIAAILMVFRKTRLSGLLLALGIYTNVVLIDFEFGVNDAVQHATIECMIVLIWLLPYLRDLKKYLWDMGGRFVNSHTDRSKLLSIYLPLLFITGISAYAVYLHRVRFNPPNQIVGEYQVLELSIDAAELELGKGEYTETPMLFFEFRKDFVLSVCDSSYSGNYRVAADSIFLSFNKKFRNIRSLEAKICDGGMIRGLTDRGQSFEIRIEKNLSRTKKQQSDSEVDAALKFINLYVDNCNNERSSIGVVEWVNSNSLTTNNFKIELKRMMDEAYQFDPETGLDADPVFDAQDYPSGGFELDSCDSKTNYVTVKGKNQEDFKLRIQMILENGNWLVDGCGAINIPEEQRIAR